MAGAGQCGAETPIIGLSDTERENMLDFLAKHGNTFDGAEGADQAASTGR